MFCSSNNSTVWIDSCTSASMYLVMILIFSFIPKSRLFPWNSPDLKSHSVILKTHTAPLITHIWAVLHAVTHLCLSNTTTCTAAELVQGTVWNTNISTWSLSNLMNSTWSRAEQYIYIYKTRGKAKYRVTDNTKYE